MSSQRYERVANADDDAPPRQSRDGDQQEPVPSSPPPSFHSRDSSLEGRRSISFRDPFLSDADRALADSFDPNSDDDDDDDDDRSARARTQVGDRTSSSEHADASSSNDDVERRRLSRRVTELPVFTTPGPATSNADGTQRRLMQTPNDGVFANMSAKPDRGEKLEDQPPSYEQAAADATPPYWETTIMAPGFGTDEVYIDGLPVGSFFSFAWNGLISMSFHFVGFLLTYLLHTTHAAKNGSKAGLGVSLVQAGFAMRSPLNDITNSPPAQSTYNPPQDPNSHDVGSMANDDSTLAALNAVMESQGPDGANTQGDVQWTVFHNDYLAYMMMIMGWFLLIRSVGNYVKVRRHEQLVLQSPDRGLGVAIVAEGERPETAV